MRKNQILIFFAITAGCCSMAVSAELSADQKQQAVELYQNLSVKATNKMAELSQNSECNRGSDCDLLQISGCSNDYIATNSKNKSAMNGLIGEISGLNRKTQGSAAVRDCRGLHCRGDIHATRCDFSIASGRAPVPPLRNGHISGAFRRIGAQDSRGSDARNPRRKLSMYLRLPCGVLAKAANDSQGEVIHAHHKQDAKPQEPAVGMQQIG